MALVAGVDSSTQSCKVVIRDLETGALVRQGRAPHPDGTEVSADRWWDAFLTAVDDAGGLVDVAAISIAAQQHGMVALDEHGRLVRDALLWNDTRSADAASDLIEEVGASELAERSGSVPVASFTIAKARWLRDAEPENAARVAAVALPHDWLTWRLLGYGPADASPLGAELDALTTDRSDASGTGYWSPRTGGYDLELFETALGRPAREARSESRPGAVVLPRVIAPDAAAGATAGSAVIPAGIVVGPGLGDNAGAALGLGAASGDLIISIGTSGTAFAVTDTATNDPSGTVAGFADGSGRFLPLIATLNAARVLTSVAELLQADYDGLAALAMEAEPGADGLVLVPHFEGERTPNLPDATATLSGLTLRSATRPNLARAGIEGMLSALAEGAAAVIDQGVAAERIILIGGAALNPAVQVMAAQCFTLPVSIPSAGEYVADGACRQAARVLTGSDPAWSVDLNAELAPDPHPLIRQRYQQARALGSVPRSIDLT